MIPDVGFCSVCGILREDHDGVPVTDCLCTAKERHKPGCIYLLEVGCLVDLCTGCTAHGLFACEKCDCTCGVTSSPRT